MANTMNPGNKSSESDDVHKKNRVKAAPDIYSIIRSVLSVNQKSDVRKASTNITDAAIDLENYFSSDKYTYLGKRIPKRVLAEFTSGFEKAKIKHCEFLVLYGGRYGFAIARYKGELMLLVKTYQADPGTPDAVAYGCQGMYSFDKAGRAGNRILSLYVEGNEFIINYRNAESGDKESARYPVLNPPAFIRLIHFANDLLSRNRATTKTEGVKVKPHLFPRIKIASRFSLALQATIARFLILLLLNKCS